MSESVVVSSGGVCPSTFGGGFPNMAGASDCDETLAEELQAAGITVYRASWLKDGMREVDTEVLGHLDPSGWGFKRAWYYWVADGPGIPPDDAWKLHRAHGHEVRVDGLCGCLGPDYTRGFGIGFYHVDTPVGLKALADTIKGILRRNEAAGREGK